MDKQRAGQKAFNDLHLADPELANQLRGTDADPFYDDRRLPEFKRRVDQLREKRGY